MFTSTHLKAIITEARPIIERQLDDAELIAGIRTKVTNDGGDWGQVKALLKAMIQDERDEAGGNKRVTALLGKAEHATAYADMLGLGSLNEKNSFPARETLASTTAADPVGASDLGASTDRNFDPGTGAGSDTAVAEGGQPQHVIADAPAGTAGSEKVEAERKDQNALVPSSDGGPIPGAAGSIAPRTIPEPVEGGIGEKPVTASAPAGETSAPASPAFAPGSVRYEHAPTVPVAYSEIIKCFPDMSIRGFVALVEDIRTNGVQQPILMQGEVLLDGRERYNAARKAGVDYPVKEYDGDDPLVDIIKLNLASRKLDRYEREAVAKRLIKVAPDREADIVELMGLEQRAAA